MQHVVLETLQVAADLAAKEQIQVRFSTVEDATKRLDKAFSPTAAPLRRIDHFLSDAKIKGTDTHIYGLAWLKSTGGTG